MTVIYLYDKQFLSNLSSTRSTIYETERKKSKKMAHTCRQLMFICVDKTTVYDNNNNVKVNIVNVDFLIVGLI